MKLFKIKIIAQIILITLPFLVTPILMYYNGQTLDGLKFILFKKYFSEDIKDVETIISSLKINSSIITLLFSTLLSCILLTRIRRWNSDKYITRGNSYINCSFMYFFIAGRILNYGKINLVRIPIWLQYSILIAETFDEVTYSNDLEVDNNHLVTKVFKNDGDYSRINLVIEDTYPIKLRQIPKENRMFPSIIISRVNIEGRVRKYNQELVNLILKNIYQHEKELKELNIYATTNTKHNYEIVEKCFKTGNRSSNYKLNIYQQSSEKERLFITKHPIKGKFI